MSSSSGLGKLLVQEGLLTDLDRRTIIETSGSESSAFAKGIIAVGLLDEDELAIFLSDHTNYEVVPKDIGYDSEAVQAVDSQLLRILEVLPVEKKANTLYVAMADPLDKETVSQLEFFTGLKIRPVIATFSQIQSGLARVVTGYKPKSSPLEEFLTNHADTAARRLIIDESSIFHDKKSPKSKVVVPPDADIIEEIAEGDTDLVTSEETDGFEEIENEEEDPLDAAPTGSVDGEVDASGADLDEFAKKSETSKTVQPAAELVEEVSGADELDMSDEELVPEVSAATPNDGGDELDMFEISEVEKAAQPVPKDPEIEIPIEAAAEAGPDIDVFASDSNFSAEETKSTPLPIDEEPATSTGESPEDANDLMGDLSEADPSESEFGASEDTKLATPETEDPTLEPEPTAEPEIEFEAATESEIEFEAATESEIEFEAATEPEIELEMAEEPELELAPESDLEIVGEDLPEAPTEETFDESALQFSDADTETTKPSQSLEDKPESLDLATEPPTTAEPKTDAAESAKISDNEFYRCMATLNSAIIRLSFAKDKNKTLNEVAKAYSKVGMTAGVVYEVSGDKAEPIWQWTTAGEDQIASGDQNLREFIDDELSVGISQLNVQGFLQVEEHHKNISPSFWEDRTNVVLAIVKTNSERKIAFLTRWTTPAALHPGIKTSAFELIKRIGKKL